MRSIAAILFFLMHTFIVCGQRIDSFYNTTQTKTPKSFSLRNASSEICNNNIDDDNNGLTDHEDFNCFFNGFLPSCTSSIIWACSGDGRLCWVNLATGTEHLVANSLAFGDLAWANGKLYGYRGTIWEIDPNTGAAQLKITLPPEYASGNSMTADSSGNLYLSIDSKSQPFQTYILKVNIATGQHWIIANLTPANLYPAGDLTFFNGSLYLSCTNNSLAKIDLQTGAIQVLPVINPAGAYFGLVTIGDGYLYASFNNQIYRIDPQTMTAGPTPVFSFSFPNLYINGLAAYPEGCAEPQCSARVSIETSAPPFCPGAVIRLRATTSIPSQGDFTWTDPSSNVSHSDTLMAPTPGWYLLNYHDSQENCSVKDSFFLQYTCPNIGIHASGGPPYCQNVGTLLHATTTCPALNDFTWTTPAGDIVHADSVKAMTAGMYFLKYTTQQRTCDVLDSFFLQFAHIPSVNLGNDTALCDGEQLHLSVADPGAGFTSYEWQDGSSNQDFTASAPGWYWVSAGTVCGFEKDSLYIQRVTVGCETNFFVPTGFTPNGDGHNDIFKPIFTGRRSVNEYEFTVFNRWGQVVFRTRNLSDGWDGTINGLTQNTGLYIWTCRYRIQGRQADKKGTVLLIRN
jgi:gliding motility-associated-like protein